MAEAARMKTKLPGLVFVVFVVFVVGVLRSVGAGSAAAFDPPGGGGGNFEFDCTNPDNPAPGKFHRVIRERSRWRRRMRVSLRSMQTTLDPGTPR